MASDESWQLRDVAPEVRETAREAARRRGLSVGQWLQSVIVDSAAKPSAPAALEQNQSAGRNTAAHDKLDALSDQLARLERAGASPPSGAATVGGENPELSTRLRNMEGRIASIGKTASKTPPTQQLVDVLAALNHRLDRLMTAGGEKLRGFSFRTSEPSETAAAGAIMLSETGDGPPDEWSIDLDQAVAEIAERQRVLDGAAGQPSRTPPPAHSPPPPPAGGYFQPAVGVAVSPGLSELEKRLGQLSDELSILRQPGGFADGVLGLREQLSEIGRTLADAAPRRALQAVETEIRALADRLGDRRQFDGDSPALAGVEQGLAEVREALRSMAPAESLAAFRDDVRALDRKIELAAAQGFDSVALQPLQDKVAELRDIATHAASGDGLVALAEEVQRLADKIERFSPQKLNDELLAGLDRRFQEFAADLNHHAPAAAPSVDHLVSLVETLSDKIGSLELGRENLPTLDAVMTQLMRLTERIEFSGARMENLDKLERTFNVLLDRMDALRADTLAAAERVARETAEQHVATPSLNPRDFEAIKSNLDTLLHSHVSSDRRTQDTLEAVHDTLERLVDRIAVVETGIHGEASRAAPRVADPLRVPEPVRAPTIVPSDKPYVEPAAFEPARAAADRRPIDPTLPADFPLEPGAVHSRGASSAAERIAASEAVLGGRSAAPVDAKSNFIAAARRAAQAAANMSAAPDSVPEVIKAEPSTLASLAQKFTRRTPLMLVGILTLLGGITLHIVLNGIDTGPAVKFARHISDLIASKPAQPTKRETVAVAKATIPVTSDPAVKAVEAMPAAPPQTVSDNAAKPAAAPSAPAAPGEAKLAAAETGETTASIPQTPPASSVRTMPSVSPLTIATISLPAGDVTGSLGRATGMSSKPAADGKTPPVVSPQGTPAASLPERLRAAAAAGDANAEYEIAARYAEGRGVPMNLEEAARWFERAATRDLAPAQYRLGSLYEKGQGVKKDLDQARRLYRAAAEKGNGKSMHNLAVLYAEGVDGTPDFKAASQWFRKAADRGVADSQFNLGILYARGLGVEQNLAESYKWFALSAKQGDKDAGKKRDDVAGRLDAQAIIAARLAVQTFTAEPQPPEAVTVAPPAGGWEAAVPPAPPARAKGKVDIKAKSGAVAPRKVGS